MLLDHKDLSEMKSTKNNFICFTCILPDYRDTVPEITDSGPMCITDLFQNKSVLSSCGRVVRDFEREAKTMCNF
jgi:hypothetical protein